MIIVVNDEPQTWEGSDISVTDLLARNKVEKPEMVSVQINGVFLDKKDYGTRKVAENDVVDFLYFMGGGKAT